MNEEDDFYLHITGSSLTPNSHSPLIVRICEYDEIKGGQSGPIRKAIGEFMKNNPGLKVIWEIIDLKHIKNENWTPSDLFSWLLSSHIHIICSHMHQGMVLKGLRDDWNIPNFLYWIRLLTYHSGFPSGLQLQCPVFTQDKYAYISCVPHLFLPTLKVPISGDFQSINQNPITE